MNIYLINESDKGQGMGVEISFLVLLCQFQCVEVLTTDNFSNILFDVSIRATLNLSRTSHILYHSINPFSLLKVPIRILK